MAKTIVTGSRDKGYILYDDGTILLMNVRMVYPHLGRPFRGKPNDDGTPSKPKHSMKVMMPKGKGSYDNYKKLLDREIGKLLAAKNNGQDLPYANKCLKDGDMEGKDFMKGMYVLNTSENEDRPPALRTEAGGKIDRDVMGEGKIDAMFQGGYWANVLVALWYQPGYGKKVNCSLRAVQMVRKDEVIAESGISDEDVDDAFGIADGSSGFEEDEEL